MSTMLLLASLSSLQAAVVVVGELYVYRLDKATDDRGIPTIGDDDVVKATVT